jgi:putative toxin-antitoxin system antitoxin component (TIGR02293 family)
MIKTPKYHIESAISQILRDNEVLYQTNPDESNSHNLDFTKDKLLLNQFIVQGVSYKLFEQIQIYSPFTELQWAEMLEVSTKSLQRYKSRNNYRFKVLHSEKIIEVLEILVKGQEVFGSKVKFEQWLSTPSFALGDHKPVDLIKTSYGQELVMAELTHIDYGIFA